MRALRLPVTAMAAAVVIAGCGTAPKSPPAAQPSRTGGFYQDDGPPAQVPADILSTPDAVPRSSRFTARQPPLPRAGRSYTPITDDRPLVQRGYASWYAGSSTATAPRPARSTTCSP